MLKPLITIEDWSGGASYNPSKGKKNGYFTGTGVDHNTRSGYLTVLPGKERYQGNGGASHVGDNIYCGVQTNRNGEYYFGGTIGQLYRQDADPSLTLEHTSSNSSNISNVIEYKSYLYYAQNTTIGRGDLSTANPITCTDNWQTGLTASTWKPMVVSSDNNLYIGHDQYVAKWDDTTFTLQALDLPDDYIIQDMDDFGIQYLAIGANSQNTSQSSKIFLWDRLASTWNNEVPIPEKNIYSMLTVNGVLWFLAGSRNISLYALPIGSTSPIKIKEWSSEYITNQIPLSYPNAITYRDGRLFFAISGVYINTSLTTPSGIFSVKTDINDIDFQGHFLPFDEFSNNLNYFYFIENMAYIASDNGLRWSHVVTGTSAVQDMYREQNRLGDTVSTSGSLYTFWYQAPAGTIFHFDGFGFDCYPRDTGYITLEYSTDFGSSYTTIFSTFQTTGSVGSYKSMVVTNVKSIQFRVTLGSSSSQATSGENFMLKRIFATGKLLADNR